MLNVKHLNGAAVTSYVCHLNGRNRLAPEIAASGVPVFSVVTRGPLAGFRRVLKIAALVRKLNIDVIHATNYSAELHAGLASKVTGVPAIATLTSIGYEPVKLVDNKRLSRSKLLLIGFVRGAVLRWTHKRYAAVCQYVKESNVKSFHLRPERVTIIHRGLPDGFENTDRARVEALRVSLAPGADPLVVAVGRLIPAKGHKYLLQAMPAVLAQLPKARLVVAGGGWLDGSLKKAAQDLGVSHAVSFLGSRDDVPELLAAADIFVMPSLYEGAGVALVEACAVGVASIATRVGGLPEVIEDGRTGLIVEPQSPDALVSAIVRLARDPTMRAAMGSEARRHVKATFSIADSVRRLEGLYKTVVSQNGR